MIIHSRFKDYTVAIEENLDFLKELSGIPNTEFVIDKKVYHLYEERLIQIPQERLILIDAIEETAVYSFWTFLIQD